MLTRRASKMLSEENNTLTTSASAACGTNASTTVTTATSITTIATTFSTTDNPVLASSDSPNLSISSDSGQQTVVSPSFMSVTAQNIRRQVREGNVADSNAEGPVDMSNIQQFVEASVGLCQARLMREVNEKIQQALLEIKQVMMAQTVVNSLPPAGPEQRQVLSDPPVSRGDSDLPYLSAALQPPPTVLAQMPQPCPQLPPLIPAPRHERTSQNSVLRQQTSMANNQRPQYLQTSFQQQPVSQQNQTSFQQQPVAQQNQTSFQQHSVIQQQNLAPGNQHQQAHGSYQQNHYVLQEPNRLPFCTQQQQQLPPLPQHVNYNQPHGSQPSYPQDAWSAPAYQPQQPNYLTMSVSNQGKKGKKNKGTVISLQSFLSDVDNPVGTTQVAKSIRNIDGEDSDEGEGVLTVVCQLPTAPRANRIFDDDAIPYKSPYIACITNLPFDVNEEDIYEYFNVNSVKSVRLPRDDGDTGRVRGFGYVEFDSRDDLIHALGMRDPIIKGRRIRINLSNENEQNSRQHGAKRGFDSTTNKLETRDLDNWRRDNTKRDSFNFGVERPLRDQKHLYDENNSPGSWRTKNRTDFPISSSVEQLNQEECNFHKNTTSQRPKLMLKPRTLPLPELDVANQESMTNVINPLKFAGTSAEKVFGLARPVDTTARDLEIEERLEDFRRQENLRQQIIKTTSDLNELSIVKDEEVTSLNWRTLNEDIKTSKNQDGKNFKSDTRRENVKENRRKSQEKSKGYDSQKKKEGKRKDTMKFKPELKIDRHVGKNVCNQNENIMSTNKYSGLEDDSE